MSVLRHHVTAILLLSLAAMCAAGEFEIVSALRSLSTEDIGKVFIKPDQPQHPNFGNYLVLTSVDTDLYGFDSFDWQGGRPVGKLHVSYVALPLFREVAVDAKTMTKVRTAIEEAEAAHDRSLEEFRRQMDELRRSRAGEKAPPPNTSLERTRER